MLIANNARSYWNSPDKAGWRLETHICISFVAYKVYKELERQLKQMKSAFSPEKAIETAKTIYQVRVSTQSGEVSHIMLISQEQQKLARLFNFG